MVTNPQVWWKALLTSRKFWVTVLTLVVLIVAGSLPNFTVDAEAGASLLIVVFGYLVGTAIDPGSEGWQGVIRSRKFWISAVGFVVMTLNAFGLTLPFNLTQDTFVEIAIAIGGLVTTIGIRDATLAAKTSVR